ncbi:hypothetical protein BGZ61DRAFT_185927 [Ilyonectria robusta]|uniref:uncharacterized protein n=1 Tax=Ilyonectria robusta TaxID=1079257 RepID=UPI001E8D92A7|nr:uncharacterized protein BGZ61DRAFT_185927 [Ilyonectria robusta]KAH8729669.1 hypothetical protein BGZ61DRAFT_185927 [Ilyonectria robusta]
MIRPAGLPLLPPTHNTAPTLPSTFHAAVWMVSAQTSPRPSLTACPRDTISPPLTGPVAPTVQLPPFHQPPWPQPALRQAGAKCLEAIGCLAKLPPTQRNYSFFFPPPSHETCPCSRVF